ncbi:MAG TPA: hypothetical protein DHU16_04380 [Gammaproteobacteria bacterium]|nr:hypothetical protein [Gammaproteobacteria bacterium]
MADLAPDSSEVAGVKPVVARLSVSAKFFIVLSLVLSVAAALLAAWMYAQVVSRDTAPDLMLAEKISVLQSQYEVIADGQRDLAAQAVELSTQGRELDTAFGRADVQLEQRLITLRAEFSNEIQKITRDSSRLSLLLELLEVRYLLRSAALRMHFQHDFAATVVLLEGILDRLREIDDLVVLPLRTQIEQDLEAVNQIASEGIQEPLRKLEAIEVAWPELLPGGALELASMTAETPSSIGAQLLREVSQLLQVRYLSEADDYAQFDANAYISEIERDLLRLKFDAAITQSRVALMRLDTTRFYEHLSVLTQWHQQFTEADNAAAQANLIVIEELGKLDLAPQQYDLSLSIELIDQLLANRK